MHNITMHCRSYDDADILSTFQCVAYCHLSTILCLESTFMKLIAAQTASLSQTAGGSVSI
jgi:hypothetical protein